MKIDDYEDDFEEEEEEEEWADRYQISYTSGKPAPMKTKRKKSASSWQRIEQLKDEAQLNKLTASFDLYD